MIYKKAFLIFIFMLLSLPCLFAKNAPAPKKEEAQNDEESTQQISEFSLAGYGDRGKKAWDLSGKSADIFDDVVKLKDLTGNLYGEKETVQLTADRGDFNKSDGKIHVEENVVITTSSGAKLTTDSLDWDRTNSVVSTKDVVNIHRDNMFTTARGAYGQPNLNKMDLEKDVKVEITPQTDPNKVVIICDGPLQVDYEKNVATFNKNVKVDRQDSQIYCDIMDVYFGNKDNKDKGAKSEAQSPMLMGSSIDKIVARGNVKTVRGENITYSEEAIYNGADKKITLSGRPKLIIYSTEDFKGVMQ